MFFRVLTASKEGNHLFIHPCMHACIHVFDVSTHTRKLMQVSLKAVGSRTHVAEDPHRKLLASKTNVQESSRYDLQSAYSSM